MPKGILFDNHNILMISHQKINQKKLEIPVDSLSNSIPKKEIGIWLVTTLPSSSSETRLSSQTSSTVYIQKNTIFPFLRNLTSKLPLLSSKTTSPKQLKRRQHGLGFLFINTREHTSSHHLIFRSWNSEIISPHERIQQPYPQMGQRSRQSFLR